MNPMKVISSTAILRQTAGYGIGAPEVMHRSHESESRLAQNIINII